MTGDWITMDSGESNEACFKDPHNLNALRSKEGKNRLAPEN